MRARIDSIDLIGGGRRVEFGPGLNIVRGPITTGKTTLLRLAKLLMSSSLDVSKLPREVRDKVTAVAGTVVFGDLTYSIVRPYVSTTTAKVDIAGPNMAWRLPASQPDETSNMTYGQWLLRALGLPEVRVPSAPTRVDSDSTPVTVNDYMLYCDLPQDDICERRRSSGPAAGIKVIHYAGAPSGARPSGGRSLTRQDGPFR